MYVVACRQAALFSVLLMSAPVHAYIGPGAGLSAIGSALALIGAVLLMIVGFVWYPVKRLLRRRKPDPHPTEVGAQDAGLDDSQEQYESNPSQTEQS